MASRSRSSDSLNGVLADAYLLSAKNSNELTRRLEVAVKFLQEQEQTEDGLEGLPPGLENLAAQLIAGQVLASRNKVT